MTPTVSRNLRSLQIGQMWQGDISGGMAGGLENVYRSLCFHLPAAGVDVVGMVAGRSDAVNSHNVFGFAGADTSLMYRLWSARRLFTRLVEERRPDVVASHFALFTSPVIDLVRKLPMVVHFHGPWALEGAAEGQMRMAVRAKAALERLVYGQASEFVVLSRAFGQILHRRYGVDEDRIHVVPSGIDLAPYESQLTKREARERLGWPTDRPVIFVVRRLVRRTGIDNLIEAIADVRRHFPDVQVMVAGAGPERATLDGMIDHLGIAPWVRLIGFVSDEDLRLAYRAADFTVVPSRDFEGFGLTTIESLAAGTPALVTPVGGLPEVVGELSSDLILGGNSPEHLAIGIREALGGRRVLPGVAECRGYVANRYAWNAVASRVGGIYRKAAS
jgi:glycosyltransferase involved in cell wall biosynthesis